MERVNGADWFDIGGGKHGFRSQNAGLGIPGTEVTDDWLNDVQEEVAKVIEVNGIALDAGDRTQLWKALRRMVTRGIYVADTGAANAIAVAPAVALAEGSMLLVKVAATNNAATTINVDASGAVALQRRDGSALAAGDVVVGQYYLMQYTGAVWRLVNRPYSTAAQALDKTNESSVINPKRLHEVLDARASQANVVSYQTPGSYNWVVPAGVYEIRTDIYSGGSSGARRNGTTSGGNGGSSGGFSLQVWQVTPGQTVAIVVGAGAAAETDAFPSQNAGGLSSVTYNAVTVTVTGAAASDTPGEGSGGLINLTGGTGSSVLTEFGGDGGICPGPYGCAGARGRSTTLPAKPGIGGGGGGAGTVGNTNGGPGGDGAVFIFH